MQKDDQGKEKGKAPAEDELSAVWRELLGGPPPTGNDPATSDTAEIPILESDPWSSLVHEQGIKVVDLQKNHLRVSDGDVEQMLQHIQEQPASEDKDSSPKHQ
jgi:hypothetical protein